MTIGERLTIHGAKVSRAVWGVEVTIASTGERYLAEFERVPMIEFETDQGTDPREACYWNFIRPSPALVVGEYINDLGRQNSWRVVSDREDHPYEPFVRFKVEKVIE